MYSAVLPVAAGKIWLFKENYFLALIPKSGKDFLGLLVV